MRGEGGGAGSATQTMLPSVHLTSSPAGDNNGVSTALHVYTLLDFSLAGFSARTAQSPNNREVFQFSVALSRSQLV